MPRRPHSIADDNPARPLRAFLFEPHPILGATGQPLFISPAELGARFASLSRGPLYEVASGKAYTAQVLQGKRACSLKLRVAFRAAVRDRLEDAGVAEGDRDAVVARLEDHLEQYNARYNDLKKARCVQVSPQSAADNKTYSSGHTGRRSSSRTTQIALVVSPRYQLARHSKVGVKQIQQLASLLKLIEPGCLPERRFLLCLDGLEAAQDVWQSLVEEGLRLDAMSGALTREALNPREEARLQNAVLRRIGVHVRRLGILETQGFLTTYTVPLSMCLVPLTLYDPGTSHCRATVLRYASSAMDPQVNLPAELFKDVWQQFWNAFEQGAVVGIDHVPFVAVRDAVVRDCLAIWRTGTTKAET